MSDTIPDLRKRLGDAHDASLDDDHRSCRAILMECIRLLDEAPAAAPAPQAVPAEVVAVEPSLGTRDDGWISTVKPPKAARAIRPDDAVLDNIQTQLGMGFPRRTLVAVYHAATREIRDELDKRQALIESLLQFQQMKSRRVERIAAAPAAPAADAVIADLAAALDMFVGTNPIHSLCMHEGMDAFGRVKGTWSKAAECTARAALLIHRTAIDAAQAAGKEGA